MAKKIVPLRPHQPKGSGGPIAHPSKGLTLADVVSVTHTVGNHVTTVRGAELARLIDATRHLHDPDDSSDFIDPISIATELGGVADVLLELGGDDRPSALSYLSDQLRRLSNRVAAIAPQSGHQHPDWYKVEVTS